MRNLRITYVISSEDSEQLRLARQLVADRVQPDSLHSDVGTAKERVYIHRYTIDDYFSSIQIADNDPTSFRIVFSPLAEADRYWKDVVVKILASIRGAGASVRHER